MMTEVIFKRSDYVNSDPDKDRRAVHKKTDFGNFKPDGWSSSPNWAESSYPVDFIVVKVPDWSFTEAEAADYRRSWRDDFDYEIVATRPVSGEYDIRIFEKNPGVSNQNAINGTKATRVRSYLQGWGCSAFSMGTVDASFTFSLWDAVRSPNFWNAPLVGTRVSFALNSYTPGTGIGNITVTIIDANLKPEQVVQKIIWRNGTVIAQDATTVTFEVERSSILTVFRADVKRRIEQVYVRHRYGISQADHDAVVAAGGIVTITKAQFLNKLIDKMAAV